MKLGLFDVDNGEAREVWRGEADAGTGLGAMIEGRAAGIAAVGHRIVHGGPKLRETTRLTPEVRTAIEAAVVMDPEHARRELAAIDEVTAIAGDRIPQFVVFDTAFFASLPEAAYVYPLPYALCEQGIRRYGFHGISHQYISRRAAEILRRPLAEMRLITCHLGNGCSLAAISQGRAVDTTMGFTPLEGLMMGTRSGSVDPGILFYLMRERGSNAAELDHMLNEESGLKGVSGVSADMREVLRARAAGNQRAQLAFEVFMHRLRREMGAMLAVLGGADAFVFAGGIGEHVPEIRAAAVEAFAFLGARINDGMNAQPPDEDCDLAATGSAVRTILVRTREDEEMAREVWRIQQGQIQR